jgi:sodium-dependent phosphate cotransporter
MVSIQLISSSFKLLGNDFAKELLAPTANPLVALLIGILATAVVQSSSATTSIVVGMVAAGSLGISGAIPIIMGANIGTTVTNTIVSLGHISRKQEFKRALAGATMHDFFNLSAVLLFFPLELLFHPIEKIAGFLSQSFAGMGGLTFVSPLKVAVSPVAKLAVLAMGANPWIVLVVALALLLVSLRGIVSSIKTIALEKIEAFLDVYLFRNAATAFLFGLIFTAVLQSSSITTSLIIPLIGAGALAVRKAFPYTLGANIGTTVTALLASLALGVPAALTVALAHLTFNILGVAVFYPLRRIPIGLAERFAEIASSYTHFALIFLATVFYFFPLILIILLR